MSGTPLEIWHREDDAFVTATLHADLAPVDLTLLERSWGPARLRLLTELEKADVPRRERPQSLHWNWEKKLDELKLLEAKGFGVLCEDEWQAAMMTKSASQVSRLPKTRGKPLIYIDYLETAPWNWKLTALQQRGKFGGLGPLMVRQAIVQSIEEGFRGRVGLHALPQAESFYTQLGMEKVAFDAAKKLWYHELTEDHATRLLDPKGGAS